MVQAEDLHSTPGENMELLKILHRIRNSTGPAGTVGLDDKTILFHIEKDPVLGEAIEEAEESFRGLASRLNGLLELPEDEVCQQLQKDILNFYPDNQINPYVALAAKGPWVITLHGAVLHDSGGYGMLGFGHDPDQIVNAMYERHVMANVMTPSLYHKALTERLRKAIGHKRGGGCPYDKFLFVNSGSESVTVALRLSDINSRIRTDKDGSHAGQKILTLALKGGFHGRTDRPSHASDSTRKAYQVLATFRDQDDLLTVEPNDVKGLQAAFDQAKKDKVFIEAMLMEPVMGEGSPGTAVTPEFYGLARKLTRENGALLIVDSIQAGLRGTGHLSIVDYPGFTGLDAPDMETYSKALNAGQFPMSVLAMTTETAALYVKGVYGNTMTANPRAMAVACAVLDAVTPEVRSNIREKGAEILKRFGELQKKYPDVVTGVSGTGLLCALHLKPEGYAVVGEEGVERWMRLHGIGVIHGGKNALRFTPHFRITSDEIDLIVECIDAAISRGPVYR